MRLLDLLLAFLRPAVDDPADPPVNDEPQDPPADDPQADLDLAADDPADPPALEPAEELRAARDEAKRARDDAERYQRELTEARTAHRPAPQANDEQAREDARLADPQTPDLEKWQIKANRELRAGRSAAAMALAQAHDVSDKTSFASIAMSDPRAKKYETRVEQELAKIRAQGGNATREQIYTFMIGQDVRAQSAKKKPAAAAPAKTVDRGRTPGVRSDTPGRGGALTEHEKRAKRLENVQI